MKKFNTFNIIGKSLESLKMLNSDWSKKRIV